MTLKVMTTQQKTINRLEAAGAAALTATEQLASLHGRIADLEHQVRLGAAPGHTSRSRPGPHSAMHR